jgi:peroxiredoxin Q/BCP
MKPLKVGEKVSSFTVKDHLGNSHSLENYKGSKVVVFFLPQSKYSWMYC